MAHEVTMPQLGMAQDSGVITAWLKVPGEQVRAGDALFEVETDKATMEIEAQADGWLSPPLYDAGSEVPVGAVIARLADSAEDAADPAAEPAHAEDGDGDTTAPAPAAPAHGGGNELPDGAAVIMPALGMAQDTGVLLGWLKEPGAAVGADEPLFEVETDKASMEVEAGQDGYLAAVLAAPGDEVPVGQTIAVIAPEAPSTPLVRTLGDTTAVSAAPAAAQPAEACEAAPAEVVPDKPAAAPSAGRTQPAQPRTDGRILASPKARRLARERGLDLSRLVRMGVAQPYHVADLETLAQAGPDAGAAFAAGGFDQFEAEAPAAPLADLLDWLVAETAADAETGAAGARAAVLAAFATGALRQATEAGEAALQVQVATPASGVVYQDADRGGLAAVAPVEGAGTPDLILRDLSATRLSGARLARDGGAPVLTLAAAPQGRLRATLTCAPGALPEEAAIALLESFAARLDEPLRHLL